MKIQSFLKKSAVIPVIFAAREFENRLIASLRPLDLGLSESLVLVSIFFEGRDCRPSELAATLGMSRPLLSLTLKNLAIKELLTRQLESSDARFIAVKLTPQGRAKSQKLIKIFDRLTDDVEKVIGVKKAEDIAHHLFSLTLS